MVNIMICNYWTKYILLKNCFLSIQLKSEGPMLVWTQFTFIVQTKTVLRNIFLY